MSNLLKSLAPSLVVFLLAVAPAPATVYLDTDFQAGVDPWNAGWYVGGGLALTDLGGGNVVLADTNSGAPGVVDNYPATFPAAIQIDMDLARTADGDPGDYFGVFFHLENGGWGSPTGQMGYQLHYAGSSLELVRKDWSYGPETWLATSSVGSDTLQHHLRITDNGSGAIRIYWDNMVTPAISLDDSAGYVGGAGRHMSVRSGYGVNGWFDHVVVQDYVPVPEPVSLLLMSVGLLAVARRRATQ